MLYQLHWLLFGSQGQFQMLVLIFKATEALEPGYLKDCLCSCEPVPNLRSAAAVMLSKWTFFKIIFLFFFY